MNVYDLPSDLSRGEAQWFREAIPLAIEAARSSQCSKDTRGAAVWHHNYGCMTAASNSPPAPFVCDGSAECKAACGKLATHAEERALNRYLRAATGFAATDMTVLHIRVVNGEPVTSGAPFCVTCSRTILEASARKVWLWHESGWTAYSAADFHRTSLQHEKHRLPVITMQAVGRTFMDRACAGEFGDLHTAMDDAIDAWHAGLEGPPLHVALGMTWDEYALWVKSPRRLDEIVARHATKETAL